MRVRYKLQFDFEVTGDRAERLMRVKPEYQEIEIKEQLDMAFEPGSFTVIPGSVVLGE